MIVVSANGEQDADAGFDLRRAKLSAAGVEVLSCGPKEIEPLLAALASRGISSLLVEGGAATARSFMASGMVDRILLFQGPLEIGASGIESPLTKSNIPGEYVPVRTERYGEDICYEYERGI